ncbi:putative Nuclear transport factor 2A [Blattamonas nauphoetae]|uniref:Nuclear transport factor 2 n=1 Tax=Blattamonas nauphoetae TaxID=2049346 RepID=A0ABQ9Y2S5_9EUKA|nr:putative Nuclear transport factor 2A [Blattamonas nauphoetae]
MATPIQVAQNFLAAYYGEVEGTRANVQNFYNEGSMLSYQGEETMGINAVTKIQTQPRMKHGNTQVDCQPVPASGTYIITVVGQIQTEGETHLLQYMEVFHISVTQAAFLILNQIFKLVMI